MMKQIFSLVFFSVFALSCFSQIEFQRTYGIGLYNEGRCVRQTFDGGYIIAGTESEAGNGATNIYLLKIDSLGNFMWHKTFGGNNINRGYAVEQLDDSGYLACGYTNSFSQNNDYDAYIVRTNKTGDTLWTKTFGTSDWDFVYAMKKTLDGGFIFAGNSYGNPSASSEAWIFKMDTSGDVQWSKQFSILSESFLNDIIQTPESDFVAIGYQTGGINNSEDFTVLKVTSNGDSVWSHWYGSTGNDRGTSIDIINSRNYIIGGMLQNSSSGFDDYYFVKIDSAGTEQWHNEFTSSAGDFLYSIHPVSTGFVTCGNTVGGGVGNDVALIMTDQGGGFDSSKTYGTIHADFAYCLTKCNDHGFIIVGKTNGLGPGLESVYIVKTDSGGRTVQMQVIGIDEIHTDSGKLICYPNPSDKELIVCLEGMRNSSDDKIEINIFNLEGERKVCFETNLNKPLIQNISIDVSNLVSGYYLLTAASGEFNWQRKLIILH